jgi:hypothetical protein
MKKAGWSLRVVDLQFQEDGRIERGGGLGQGPFLLEVGERGRAA